MVGSRKLPENGVMWYAPCVGKVYMTDVRTTRRNTLEEVRGEWCPVEMIDGMLMATQYVCPGGRICSMAGIFMMRHKARNL